MSDYISRTGNTRRVMAGWVGASETKETTCSTRCDSLSPSLTHSLSLCLSLSRSLLHTGGDRARGEALALTHTHTLTRPLAYISKSV